MAAPLLRGQKIVGWGLARIDGRDRNATTRGQLGEEEDEISLRGRQANQFALKFGAKRGRQTCHSTDEVKSPVGR
jgi:hypothetical protein